MGGLGWEVPASSPGFGQNFEGVEDRFNGTFRALPWNPWARALPELVRGVPCLYPAFIQNKHNGQPAPNRNIISWIRSENEGKLEKWCFGSYFDRMGGRIGGLGGTNNSVTPHQHTENTDWNLDEGRANGEKYERKTVYSFHAASSWPQGHSLTHTQITFVISHGNICGFWGGVAPWKGLQLITAIQKNWTYFYILIELVFVWLYALYPYILYHNTVQEILNL